MITRLPQRTLPGPVSLRGTKVCQRTVWANVFRQKVADEIDPHQALKGVKVC